MKRIASKGIALTVLAILAMSGPAAAFTPVPIPTPRTGSAAAAHVGHDNASAITRREE
jgi:hypothetical protein